MEQGKFPEAEKELQSALTLAEQFGESRPTPYSIPDESRDSAKCEGGTGRSRSLLQKTVAIHENASKPRSNRTRREPQQSGSLVCHTKKIRLKHSNISNVR